MLNFCLASVDRNIFLSYALKLKVLSAFMITTDSELEITFRWHLITVKANTNSIGSPSLHHSHHRSYISKISRLQSQSIKAGACRHLSHRGLIWALSPRYCAPLNARSWGLLDPQQTVFFPRHLFTGWCTLHQPNRCVRSLFVVPLLVVIVELVLR